MGKQIIYLENDHLWAEIIEPQLARHGQVRVINNEHEFRGAIDDLAKASDQWPSVVVLEQRLRWTNPAPNMPTVPSQVREEGYSNAGVRCYEYLRQAQNSSGRTPVIFYSLVEPKHISTILLGKGIKEDPMDYQCVQKGEESFVDLHQALRRVL